MTKECGNSPNDPVPDPAARARRLRCPARLGPRCGRGKGDRAHRQPAFGDAVHRDRQDLGAGRAFGADDRRLAAGDLRSGWDTEPPLGSRRNDVDYGITDRMYKFYIDYHARETWDVREQRVPVTREQADALIRQAEAYGAVNKMFCARATSEILRSVPGFRRCRIPSPAEAVGCLRQAPGRCQRNALRQRPR